MNKPKLSLEVSEIVESFTILSAMRTNNGFGLNPLSLAEIKSYIDIVGRPWMGPQLFVELIIDMDKVYMKLVSDKSKGERKSGRAS